MALRCPALSAAQSSRRRQYTHPNLCRVVAAHAGGPPPDAAQGRPYKASELVVRQRYGSSLSPSAVLSTAPRASLRQETPRRQGARLAAAPSRAFGLPPRRQIRGSLPKSWLAPYLPRCTYEGTLTHYPHAQSSNKGKVESSVPGLHVFQLRPCLSKASSLASLPWPMRRFHVEGRILERKLCHAFWSFTVPMAKSSSRGKLGPLRLELCLLRVNKAQCLEVLYLMHRIRPAV